MALPAPSSLLEFRRSAIHPPVPMSLRAKLLLLALSTLVLPVAGWLLVRQLEVLLREGQAQVQLASAQMLARAVTMQGDVFPVAGPALFVQAANAPLVLDGYDLDWRSQDLLDHGIAPGLRLALARSENQLHLLATVHDASRVRADAHWPQAASADHLLLVVEDEHGLHRLRLASAAPGPLISVPLEGEGGPRLRGEWQEDAQGYRIELRFPPAICRSGWGWTWWISPIRRCRRSVSAAAPNWPKAAGRYRPHRPACNRCWHNCYPKACRQP